MPFADITDLDSVGGSGGAEMTWVDGVVGWYLVTVEERRCAWLGRTWPYSPPQWSRDSLRLVPVTTTAARGQGMVDNGDLDEGCVWRRGRQFAVVIHARMTTRLANQ